MAKTINVALIGQGFMGRTHSNAYLKVSKFFTDLPSTRSCTPCSAGIREPPGLRRALGLEELGHRLQESHRQRGDRFVDIVTRTTCTCRRPWRRSRPKSRRLRKTDRRHPGRRPPDGRGAKKAKVPTFVWYNYRRCPAVALAHQLVKEGKLGRIFHVRCVYCRTGAGRTRPWSGGSRRSWPAAGPTATSTPTSSTCPVRDGR